MVVLEVVLFEGCLRWVSGGICISQTEDVINE